MDNIEGLVSELIRGERRELPPDLKLLRIKQKYEVIEFGFVPTHGNDVDSTSVMCWLSSALPFVDHMGVGGAAGTQPTIEALAPYVEGMATTTDKLIDLSITRIMATGRYEELRKIIARQKIEWDTLVGEYNSHVSMGGEDGEDGGPILH